MKRLPIALAAAALATLAGTVLAAPPPGDERPGRYTMHPTEGGFLRLDTATGDVTVCAKAGATFECKPVKDDRDLQSEIGRLSNENKELKADIQRLEGMLGLDGKGGQPPRKFELPSEEDVDKALSYMERLFKKFRDKLKDLEGGGKGTPL